MPRAGGALRRGQAALGRGEAEEAVRLCEAAARARPRSTAAALWLGVARSEAGDLEGALEAFDRAERWRPDRATTRLFRGRALLDHGEPAEAVPALEEGRRLDPENLHTPGYLALARWALEPPAPPPLAFLREESAGWGAGLWARWLVEAERRFPGGPGTDFPAPPEPPLRLGERIASARAGRLARRARAAASAGRTERAAGLLDRAGALWRLDEGLAELRVALHVRSAEALAERLAAEPDDVDLRLDAASELLEAGHPRGALELLEPVPRLVEALDRGRLSWNAGAALLLGRARLEIGELQPAVEHLELAASLWPTEVEPLYFLGAARLRAGRLPPARRALTSLCLLDGHLAPLRLRELGAALGGQ